MVASVPKPIRRRSPILSHAACESDPLALNAVAGPSGSARISDDGHDQAVSPQGRPVSALPTNAQATASGSRLVTADQTTEIPEYVPPVVPVISGRMDPRQKTAPSTSTGGEKDLVKEEADVDGVLGDEIGQH